MAKKSSEASPVKGRVQENCILCLKWSKASFSFGSRLAFHSQRKHLNQRKQFESALCSSFRPINLPSSLE